MLIYLGRLLENIKRRWCSFVEQRRRLRDKNPATVRGVKAEILAAKHLKKLGYKILERNWRSGHSEIDLIAQEDNCLVFIEVRSRQENALVSGYNSIDKHKKFVLLQGIRAYLRQKPSIHTFRLDVISIDWQDETNTHQLYHYENVPLKPKVHSHKY